MKKFTKVENPPTNANNNAGNIRHLESPICSSNGNSTDAGRVVVADPSSNADNDNANKGCRCRCSCCSSETCIRLFWLIKPVLVLIFVGYVASSILLYFFLPIDTAFDDATNHFISIYQTGIVFFTAVVAYFIMNKPFRSSVSIFTKAESQNPILIKEDTTLKSDEEKDIMMASEILKVLRDHKDFLEKQNTQDNSLAISTSSL